MNHFANIGVIVKPGDPRLGEIIHSLKDSTGQKGINLLLDESLAEDGHWSHAECVNRKTLAQQADAFVVIGGDGTLLNAARTLVDSGKPLIGVNAGRLGFLVDVSPEEISTQLEDILDGQHVEENRMLLHATILREGRQIAASLALNDVVLHVRDAVRMIEFETRINGQFVHLQRADGLVVSTPTGSTAYSLSGGGPILHPQLEAVALVPICPHTLSNRPIVVSSQSEISIQLVSLNRTHAQVAFDGQDNFDVMVNDIIRIQRHPHMLRLIHPPGYDYFHILRNKLRWSEQP
jgi:NAD+ kinase